MSQKVYPQGLIRIANCSVDWVSDTIKVALYDETQSLSANVEFMSQVSATEFAGSGYARATVVNKSITLDGNAVNFAGDATFSSVSAGADDVQFAIYYKEVTDDTDSPVICVGGWSTPQTPDGGDLELHPSRGVMVLKG